MDALLEMVDLPRGGCRRRRGMRPNGTGRRPSSAGTLQAIDRALPRQAPTDGRGVDLANVPLRRLVELILERRGERAAGWFRTKLPQKLETPACPAVGAIARSA